MYVWVYDTVIVLIWQHIRSEHRSGRHRGVEPLLRRHPEQSHHGCHHRTRRRGVRSLARYTYRQIYRSFQLLFKLYYSGVSGTVWVVNLRYVSCVLSCNVMYTCTIYKDISQWRNSCLEKLMRQGRNWYRGCKAASNPRRHRQTLVE